MTRPVETAATDTLKAEAMAWRMRREAADLAPGEAQAFADWQARSPEHREMYAAVDAFWSATAQLERHPRFAETRRRAAAAVDRTRLTRRAIAASLAAAVVGLGGAGLYLAGGPGPLATQSFRTAVGQQATVTLPDGSQLTLNTDTVVRTRADGERRLVYLDRGQAFFRVAKDRRHPFVVAAAGRTVTAIGTAFEVRVDKGALKVLLVEGKVRVESARPPAPARAAPSAGPAAPAVAETPMATDMSPGSQLVAADDADWRLSRADVARETSWLRGQIVVDDEALGAIVEELNRYSTRKMVVTDEGLARRRISGNFTPGDVHGFSSALRAAGVADLHEQPDGQIQIIPLG